MQTEVILPGAGVVPVAKNTQNNLRSVKFCPECRSDAEGGVVDCRLTDDSFRRRRRCSACGARWTTYEVTKADYDRLKSGGAVTNKLRTFLKRFFSTLSEREIDLLLEDIT